MKPSFLIGSLLVAVTFCSAAAGSIGFYDAAGVGLDMAAIADPYRSHIAPHHHAGPDTGVLPDLHIAKDIGRIGNQRRLGYLGCFSAKAYDWHVSVSKF